jgi:hypothetical protein
MAQPQATQPPPDLARLYLQLEQQHQMAEGFNRGLAGFLGGFKGPPGGAEQIMRGMTGGQSQDPGILLQNLLQMRQQQAQMQAFGRAIPDIAKQTNMTPDEILAAGPEVMCAAVECADRCDAQLCSSPRRDETTGHVR